MTKRFYSERDIEDLVRGGTTTLEIDDDVVLTELAYEKARQLGVRLTRDVSAPPSAPVRPYLAKPIQTSATAAVAPAGPPPTNAPQPAPSGFEERVRSAVIAKMGDQIDPALLETIIARVAKQVGVK